MNKRFDEQIKLHEEQEFNAEQRDIETMNKLELDHIETVGKIDEHSKSNLNRRITNPTEDNKKILLKSLFKKKSFKLF